MDPLRSLGGPGVPDPVTGLTDRDIRLLQTSWCKIMENSTEGGMLIMLNFFKKFPDYQELFPFADVEMDKLKDDIMFKVHCNSVMFSLSQITNNLKCTDLVIATLDKLALNHSMRKVEAKGFEDIKIVILETLQTLVSKEAFEAWQKLFDVAIGHITKQLT